MNIDEQVLGEKARQLYSGMLFSVISDYASCCLLVALLWVADPESRGNLILWNCAMGAHSFYLLRFVWWPLRKSSFGKADASRLIRSVTWEMTTTLVLWNLGLLVFFSSSETEIQYIYLFAESLIMVGGVFRCIPHYPAIAGAIIPYAFSGYVILMVKPSDTNLYLVLAVGISIFSWVMLSFGKQFNRTFIESLRLRFENYDLVAQLAREKDAAEYANLAKSKFLAAASHDLRQPMHALGLYLAALISMPTNETAQRLLASARMCVQSMEEMFRLLLDMSQLDALVVKPTVEEFSINLVLERLLNEFEPQALSKGLELRMVPSSCWVRSDSFMVERILSNFLSNALRYTDRGSILVGCRRRGTQLLVEVYDTGSGIPTSEQKAIFEEFYQIDQPKNNRARGIGLGLSIVSRLAKLLSINVLLVSHPGRGSMFGIELPFAGYQKANPIRLIEKYPDEGLRFYGRFVALVDDDPLVLDALSALLEHLGCRTIVALDGFELMEKLRALEVVPDLVICDYRLSGEENGIQVIKAIQKICEKTVPALIITADTTSEQLRDLNESGFPVLHKPVGGAALKQALTKLLPCSDLRATK